MAHTTYNAAAPGQIASPRKGFAQGYVFGAPVRDLGVLATLIMGLTMGFITFFLGTFLGIVAILFWNAAGHHADLTASYRLMGLPAGIVIGTISLAYLGTFWVKRLLRHDN